MQYCIPVRLSRVEKQAQTRGRLLEAAGELFAERGVNGASVEQIAERAGYSRGAFYSNFEDKAELVVALLQERTRREHNEVKGLSWERVRAWNRSRARNVTEWLALRTELWLYSLRDGRVRRQLAERERLSRSAHAQGLAEVFRRAGVKPPADIEFLGLIAHALEDGLLIQRAITPDEVRDEVVVDAVELLCRSWIALGDRTK